MPHQLTLAVLKDLAAGRKALARRAPRRALAFFDRACRRDPRCAQALLCRAGLRVWRGDWHAAAQDLRALEVLDHRRLPEYRDLATFDPAHTPGILRRLERFCARRPELAWGHVLLAFTLRGALRYEDAVARFDRALALRPRDAALWALSGRVQLTTRQEDFRGDAAVEKAVALKPSWGWLHCWLGEARRRRRDFSGALEALDFGLRLDPAYRPAYAWRGAVLLELGRPARALKDLDYALRRDPALEVEPELAADHKAWTHNQRMLALKALGRPGEALAALDRAHALNQRYGWAWSEGQSRAALDKGLAELDRLLARRPGLARARAWRGWTLLELGRPAEALEALDGRSRWTRAWRGRALLALGRPREALAQLCGERDVRYAPLWGLRAQAERALKRFAREEAAWSRALALDPRAAWAWAGRGECRLRRGRRAAALADFDRALAIHPAYAGARQRREEILLL